MESMGCVGMIGGYVGCTVLELGLHCSFCGAVIGCAKFSGCISSGTVDCGSSPLHPPTWWCDLPSLPLQLGCLAWLEGTCVLHHCLASLTNVELGARSTADPVDYTSSLLCWNWVFHSDQWLLQRAARLEAREADQSAVTEHTMIEDHSIKWEDTEVMNHSQQYW